MATDQKGRGELRDQKRLWAVPVNIDSGLHKGRVSMPIRNPLKVAILEADGSKDLEDDGRLWLVGCWPLSSLVPFVTVLSAFN